MRQRSPIMINSNYYGLVRIFEFYEKMKILEKSKWILISSSIFSKMNIFRIRCEKCRRRTSQPAQPTWSLPPCSSADSSSDKRFHRLVECPWIIIRSTNIFIFLLSLRCRLMKFWNTFQGLNILKISNSMSSRILWFSNWFASSNT